MFESLKCYARKNICYFQIATRRKMFCSIGGRHNHTWETAIQIITSWVIFHLVRKGNIMVLPRLQHPLQN